MRSRGAVAFSSTGSTQAALAAKLGVSTGIVAMWQSGQRTPSLENRRHILATIKRPRIPIEWWDEDPGPPIVDTKRTPSRRREPPLDDSAGDAKLARLERLADKLEQEIEGGDDVTMLERAKALALLTSTCANIKKLRGEGIPEAKILGSDRWKRIERCFIEALGPYPDALRAVGEALSELG